jgi:hypothetical protein
MFDERLPTICSRAAAPRLAFLILAALLTPQLGQTQGPNPSNGPEAEFHMARLIHGPIGTCGQGHRRGAWWCIDYPSAEFHLTRGLRRLTRLEVANDSIFLQTIDDRIFDYPWLFAQQVGHWELSTAEIERLREYLLRGGFMVVDDFHGPREWVVFTDVIHRVFPNRPIVDIPDSDSLLHILYDVDQRTQIPGRRHLRYVAGGQIVAQLEGPPKWRGIYDDKGRLLVAINFNMDMGDAWEHADDPYYPEPMTALAYRFGVNYVIYAMTH